MVRDALDAYVAPKVESEPLLPPEVMRRYRGWTLRIPAKVLTASTEEQDCFIAPLASRMPPPLYGDTR